MNKDNAKDVFNLLGFQYKPLEKQFLAFCNRVAVNHPDMLDVADKYRKADSAKKIRILDHYAAWQGL